MIIDIRVYSAGSCRVEVAKSDFDPIGSNSYNALPEDFVLHMFLSQRQDSADEEHGCDAGSPVPVEPQPDDTAQTSSSDDDEPIHSDSPIAAKVHKRSISASAIMSNSRPDRVQRRLSARAFVAEERSWLRPMEDLRCRAADSVDNR